MELRPADTDPETFRVWLKVLRNRSPEQRLQDTLLLCQQSRALSRAGIALRHPEYSEDEVEWALRRRDWGDDLFRAVYPRAPYFHS